MVYLISRLVPAKDPKVNILELKKEYSIDPDTGKPMEFLSIPEAILYLRLQGVTQQDAQLQQIHVEEWEGK